MGAAPSIRLRLVDIARKLENTGDSKSIIIACDALYSKAHNNRDKGAVLSTCAQCTPLHIFLQRVNNSVILELSTWALSPPPLSILRFPPVRY
jgi:hypothetical protein